MELVHATATLVMSAAVFLVAACGMSHLVGAKRLASAFGSSAIIAVLIAAFLSTVFGENPVRGQMDGPADEPADGSSVCCLLVVLGHIVLAVFIVARRLGGMWAEDRTEESRRGRIRERGEVEVRGDEVE